MTTTVKALTARIAHLCDSCQWASSEGEAPSIAPGHRYLRHVAFPGDEVNQTDRPYSITECVACACERDPSDGLLVAGACSTFCCGDVPCALPPHRDGDHSCRRCVSENQGGAS